MNSAAQRKVAHAYAAPIRYLFRCLQISWEEKALLILEMSSLPPCLPRLFIDAGCREAFRRLLPTLNLALSDEQVSSETKDLIRRHKKDREPSEVSEAWSELLTQASLVHWA